MNLFLILIRQSLNSQFLNLAPYSHARNITLISQFLVRLPIVFIRWGLDVLEFCR